MPHACWTEETSQRRRAWRMARARLNMAKKSTTDEVSQSPMSESNATAPLNMHPGYRNEDTSHVPIGSVKRLQPETMHEVRTTDDMSHALMPPPLNREQPMNIQPMSVTKDVSQAPMLESNILHPTNIDSIHLTED